MKVSRILTVSEVLTDICVGFKRDYPSLTPALENQQEYLEKLQEYMKDFFKTALKAPDAECIMVAKDTLVEILCKVCYALKCGVDTLEYFYFLASHILIV